MISFTHFDGRLVPIRKYNQAHDEKGKFSSASGSEKVNAQKHSPEEFKSALRAYRDAENAHDDHPTDRNFDKMNDAQDEYNNMHEEHKAATGKYYGQGPL